MRNFRQHNSSTDTNNGTGIKPTMENSVATRCLWLGNRIELKVKAKALFGTLQGRALGEEREEKNTGD